MCRFMNILIMIPVILRGLRDPAGPYGLQPRLFARVIPVIVTSRVTSKVIATPFEDPRRFASGDSPLSKFKIHSTISEDLAADPLREVCILNFGDILSGANERTFAAQLAHLLPVRVRTTDRVRQLPVSTSFASF